MAPRTSDVPASAIGLTPATRARPRKVPRVSRGAGPALASAYTGLEDATQAVLAPTPRERRGRRGLGARRGVLRPSRAGEVGGHPPGQEPAWPGRHDRACPARSVERLVPRQGAPHRGPAGRGAPAGGRG